MPQAIINSYLFSAAAPFSPSDLTNLVLWFEADLDAKSGGVAATDTDPVDEWLEQTASGADALQTTGGSEPTFDDAELNGLPVLHFDGSNDHLLIPDAVCPAFGSVDVSVYALFRVTDLTKYQFICSKDTGLSSPEIPEFRIEVTSGDVEIVVGGSISTASTPISAATWYRAGFVYDHTGGQFVTHYLNGSADGTSGAVLPSGTNTRPFFIGGRDSGNRLAGDIAALFVCKSVLSGTDIANLDAYIADKWIP